MTIPLEEYPRPSLTIDLAVFTVVDAGNAPQLCLLVQDRTDPTGRALPGGFVHDRETVAQTVSRVLATKVGIDGELPSPPRLLRVFDDPDRDDRSWVVSVAHSLSLPEASLRGARGDLVPVRPDGRLEHEMGLLFDHDQIVEAALAALRERYDFRYRFRDTFPDPDRFLPPPYTTRQLRRLHEAVVGARLHKDNFARRMSPHLSAVQRNGQPVMSEGMRGRPAALYRPKTNRSKT
ncbi:NUDIX domain-containing protein [Janibacter sp. GXQ6167]|uniref:NUDIX hydrolase n=1 Tax=Janibacter sp. GXQ6167 TaxID=3240791 RepID=UPI00352362DE